MKLWRYVEALAIISAAGVTSLNVARLVRAVDGVWSVLFLLVSLPLGAALADFVAGTVHWIGDTFGREDGSSLFSPFRGHHADPLGITRHDAIETNGWNCVLAAPFIAMSVKLAPQQVGAAFYSSAVLTALSLFLCVTNQIHKWAHSHEVHPVVRYLQRCGVMLSPEHHAGHHCGAHDRRFCVTTGWMNAPLDRLGFFQALTRALGPWAVPEPSNTTPTTHVVEQSSLPPPSDIPEEPASNLIPPRGRGRPGRPEAPH